VARGTKSRKENEKSDVSADEEASVVESEESQETPDSSVESPIVIQGEASETPAEDDAKNTVAASSEATETGAEMSKPGSVEDTPSPPVPVVSHASEASGPSFLALAFGGIVAGAIGYGASFLSPPPRPVIDPELAASVDTAGERIDALASDVAALKDAPAPTMPDVTGIETRLSEFSGRLDTLDVQIADLKSTVEQTSAALETGAGDLSQRIAALESAEPSGMPAASEDQIAAFRDRLEAITSEAEARLNAATERAAELEADAAARAEELQANAEAAAAAAQAEAARIEAEARRQAALADVKAALDSGTSFAPALNELKDAPPNLSAVAEEGVPTLAELQRAFPEAARAAVHSAAAAPEDASAGERFAAFLKRRTSARSLTPQEGTDTDAILSRAEAALGSGDLDTALAELQTLPEPAQAAMQDWLDRAQVRAAALAAVGDLTATN
jgi:hypothetical protein